MKIEIADRLKPFSHTPGHEVMIPGTYWKAKVFPAALFLTDIIHNRKVEFSLSLKGPIDPFTVEEALEGRTLRVYGQAQQGYFRFILQRQEKKLILRFEKTPEGGIDLLDLLGKEKKIVVSGDELVLAEDLEEESFFSKERLFLGSSKQKDWDAIRVRKDLREILPLWFLSGLNSPAIESQANCTQLELIEQALLEKNPKKVYEIFLETYLTHFSKGLVPRIQDEEFQGFSSHKESFKGTIHLLKQGAFLIRSLFFQEKEGEIHVLPLLSSEFVSGKMIQIESEKGDLLDLEWTKHKLRRMYIEVKKDRSFQLQFPSEVQSFRLRRSLKEKGHIFLKNETFAAKAGDRLWLDLFQK